MDREELERRLAEYQAMQKPEPVVIKALGYARADTPCDFAGQYLEWFDPDIPDATQTMATFTPDISKAKRFASLQLARLEYLRVRRVDPVRWDGQPNRPLTALAITFESVEVE